MKEQIRRNVFETNSSSVHTLTLCSDTEYQDWVSGKLLYSPWDDEFTTREEAMKLANVPDDATEEEIADILNDNDYMTYDKYFAYDWNSSLETYDDDYKTKSGEIVHAFGRYGYDG